MAVAEPPLLDEGTACQCSLTTGRAAEEQERPVLLLAAALVVAVGVAVGEEEGEE